MDRLVFIEIIIIISDDRVQQVLQYSIISFNSNFYLNSFDLDINTAHTTLDSSKFYPTTLQESHMFETLERLCTIPSTF